MTIALSDNTPRVSYTVAEGVTQTAFTVTFEFFDDADLNFYVDGTLKTLTTHYTVTGGDGSTGTINTTSGNSVTGIAGGSTVVITRSIALERTTDFPSSGAFEVATLNTELDRFTAIAAEISDDNDRSIHLADDDATVSMTLPSKANRLGKVLGFNATTGAVEAGPTIADVSSLSSITADISTLADIEDGTDATDAIQTVAGISGDVTTVAGIESNVTTVAGIETDITNVAADEADIGVVATNINSVNTVATNIDDVVTVANDLNEAISEIETAANDLNEVTSEIDTVANSIGNVDTVGTNIDDVTTVAGQISPTNNIATVAGDTTAINTVAGDSTAINTVAGDSTAINAVANDATDIGNVSTNIDDVTTVAGQISPTNNIATVASADTNISTVAGQISPTNNIATVAGDSADINTVAGLSTDIQALADIEDGTTATNAISNVGDNITNVNTVATNITGVNSFADRYRVASTAPTTSLDVGDLYYDTTSDTMKVYGSSGWQNAGSSVNGTSQRYHYDITGTPTSVTGADKFGNTLTYDAGYADVYVNGIRMSDEDITITSGDTVTFASALSNGDDVDIVAYGTFSVASLNADNLDSGTVPSARVSGAYTGITSVGTLTSFASTGIDDNASSTAITLDSSGRLLVGKTSTNFATEGVEIGGADGKIFITRDNNSLYLNRNSSDGDIVQFYKDSAKVGSIGTDSGGTYFAGNGSSLLSLGDAVLPRSTTGGSRNGLVDLGNSANVFNNLYINGGAYIGGTGSANYLDDYEEGSFTPSFSGSGSPTHSAQHGKYTKIGNRVIAHLYIAINSKGTMSGTQTISGLPFASQGNSSNYNACSIWMGAMDSTGVFNGNQAREAYLSPNQTQLKMYAASNGSVAQLDASHMANTTDVMLTVSYDVA